MIPFANPQLISAHYASDATANARTYRFVVGYRPALIQFWVAANSGQDSIQDGVAMDIKSILPVTASNGLYGGGFFREFTTTGAQSNRLNAMTPATGIVINDDGFTVGANGIFNLNSRVAVFAVFRSTQPHLTVELADVAAYKPVFGAGSQFKAGPTHSEPAAVYRV